MPEPCYERSSPVLGANYLLLDCFAPETVLRPYDTHLYELPGITQKGLYLDAANDLGGLMPPQTEM